MPVLSSTSAQKEKLEVARGSVVERYWRYWSLGGREVLEVLEAAGASMVERYWSLGGREVLEVLEPRW